MHKKIISLLLLVSSLTAADIDKQFSNLYVGLVSQQERSGCVRVDSDREIVHESDRLYFGFDLMIPSEKLSFGIGLDFVGLNSGGTRDTNANGNYTLGLQGKIGYNMKGLTSLPVLLKAGAGYGVTQYYKNNSYGWQYTLNVEAKLYKWLGAGLGYKKIDTRTEIGITDNYLLYFSVFL